eukprot:gnl/TRDRNA2_/TRDRNA2_63793_c0_seq1.p1 gnl/TRDRNA2_/TRDRNA2_63793_c0~~gnl/TRDRNA2_/TRDRNA2_63793_c0_seq1.p1  ORF type:complete len:317 (+),score=65.02 gnl/TRDRNA2_/TRDRNA2_63793_c0_seq1:12-962(+)
MRLQVHPMAIAFLVCLALLPSSAAEEGDEACLLQTKVEMVSTQQQNTAVAAKRSPLTSMVNEEVTAGTGRFSSNDRGNKSEAEWDDEVNEDDYAVSTSLKQQGTSMSDGKGPFSKGTRVRVKGLEEKTEWNGRTGTIHSWDAQKQRWRVLMDNKSRKLYRTEHLEAISSDDTTASPTSFTGLQAALKKEGAKPASASASGAQVEEMRQQIAELRRKVKSVRPQDPSIDSNLNVGGKNSFKIVALEALSQQEHENGSEDEAPWTLHHGEKTHHELVTQKQDETQVAEKEHSSATKVKIASDVALLVTVAALAFSEFA